MAQLHLQLRQFFLVLLLASLVVRLVLPSTGAAGVPIRFPGAADEIEAADARAFGTSRDAGRENSAPVSRSMPGMPELAVTSSDRFARCHRPGVAARVATTSGTSRAIAHERTKMVANTRSARRLLSTAIAVAVLGWSTVALAAAQAPAEHGLSQKAVEIARPFGFPITNSMVVTWIVALGLIVFAQLATRRMTRSPRARRTSGVARRKPVRAAREHHRPAPGRADVLVLRDDLHLHSRRQLDRPGSRRRHDRVGTPDGARLRRSTSRCSAAPTPIST